MNPKDMVRHELIGLEAQIADSTNPGIIGMKGRVVDESRNTITLEIARGRESRTRSFIKEQCTFLFTLPSGERVRVNGRLLVSRPEDRIKKKLKSW